MNDITLNLIVLTVILFVGAGIFLFVRHKRSDKEQAIIKIAGENGWKYESIREPLAWGQRLKAPNWSLEAISRSTGKEVAPGSSDVEMSTTWHADIPGSTLVIGTRTSQVKLGTFGDMLTQQVLQLALGEQADGLKEIKAGSSFFQQKYMVWAQEPADAEALLTPALESALVNWKGEKILLKRTPKGLSIELRGVRLENVKGLLSLVQLGENFL